ncbi:hypothetical protein [Variovorax sp. GT1P44]|uniref:hypothetical protein n=1 Tax=Variovorax sp. GT1P44 TaxID=3443742 RepID=UPI003F467AD9
MKARVHRIALLPITPPEKLGLRNRTLAPPLVPLSGPSPQDDEDDFSSQGMEPVRTALGARLTFALQDELWRADFEVSRLDHAKGMRIDARTVDYRTLPTRDAVLHVSFAEVGMCSSCWSKAYEPRMNVLASLLAEPRASDWLTTDLYYYGADASGETAWSRPTDPRFRYGNLSDSADELAKAYDMAIEAIAQRIVKQLCQKL